MKADFIQVQGKDLTVNNKNILLRGFALGNWMNIEHFMIGMPGPDSLIKRAFSDVYGEKNAREFFDSYLMNYISEKDFELLKSIGINSIRIPFNYKYFMDDQNPNVFLENGFRYIDHVLQFCEKYEIYAILDMHVVPGGQNPDWHADNTTGQSQFWSYGCFRGQMVSLWKYIACHYKNNSWVAGYDILNEPTYGLTADIFNDFYDRTIEAIREVDGDHVIFLEGDDFARSFELFHEPQDAQIAYAFHYYPFVRYADVLDINMSEQKRMEIFKSVFYPLLRARERFNRPLWCGESGFEYKKNQMPLYRKMISYILELCENNDVSWSLWTYKDAQAMGIAFPSYNTEWMKFRNEISKYWTHHTEMEQSSTTLKKIAETYFTPLNASLQYSLEFRMRSIFHVLAVEQVLKGKLRDIGWNTIKNYPKSFAFDNCDFHNEIIGLIKNFISTHETPDHFV